MTTFVLALEPDPGFAAEVMNAKECVRELGGAQQYLDHPPHVTLYVLRSAETAASLASLLPPLSAPICQLRGWHVFRDDALTGGHTLVYAFRGESVTRLQQLQRSLIAALSPLRDVDASRDQYATSREQLGPIYWGHVARCGYPYVGSDWHPHITVASIRPDR